MTNELKTSGTHRGRRRTVLAAVGGGAAIALIAGGAVVVATSASASGSPTQTTAAHSAAPNPGTDGPDGRGPGGAGHWGMRSGMGMALHGTFVVARPGGGYQTVAAQRGVVTALSATSITLKSEDGYTATYVLNSSTKLGGGPTSTTATAPTWLKVGAKINVEATVSGSTNTAVRVGHREPGHTGMKPPAGAPQPGWGGPGPGGSPAPAPSASSSTTTS
jgi:hypothetical protein